jgi:hypothetical protein
MSLKNNVFTLKEIGNHFLSQISMADAEFQINQRNAWIALGKADDLYAGFAKLNSLFLNEIDYSFEITPTSFSFWEKVKMFFGTKHKAGAMYYTMAKTSEASANNLKIKITIKRESAGKYDSEIKTMPETSLKNEEINVIGFTK